MYCNKKVCRQTRSFFCELFLRRGNVFFQSLISLPLPKVFRAENLLFQPEKKNAFFLRKEIAERLILPDSDIYSVTVRVVGWTEYYIMPS